MVLTPVLAKQENIHGYKPVEPSVSEGSSQAGESLKSSKLSRINPKTQDIRALNLQL